MADYKPEFADAMRAALGKHSYRKVAPLAGVSASYIGDMVGGKVPNRDTVIAVALACGVPPDDLLLPAGYAPMAQEEEEPGPVPYRRFREVIAKRQEAEQRIRELERQVRAQPPQETLEPEVADLRARAYEGLSGLRSPEDLQAALQAIDEIRGRK